MCLVSIVLPSYNGEKYLAHSINSILYQTFKDWELILVDDCSNDKTLMIMNHYSQLDNRIRVIHNNHNMNLPNSLNIGFSVANGQFLTWTSDDNVFDEKALYEMVKELSEAEDTYMVIANMYYIDSYGNKLREAPRYDKDLFWYNNNIGACFLYKREVYETIGYYNADLFGVEDYDYWIRVINHYKRINVINDILYGYRIHENSLSSQKFYDIKNKLNFLRAMHIDKIKDSIKTSAIKMALYYDMMLSEKDMTKYSLYFGDLNLGFYKEYNVNNPRVLVYGAGEYGKRAKELLGHIIAFVDSDEKKVGTVYMGKTVISISQYFDMFSDAQLVVSVDAINLYAIADSFSKYKNLNITTFHQVVNSMLKKEFEK